MKQKLFLLLLLAISSLCAEAQTGQGCTIKFDYDAAGNRVKRYEDCPPNNQERLANPDSLAALQATAEEETKEDTKENALEASMEAIDIAVLYPNPANSYCIVAP